MLYCNEVLKYEGSARALLTRIGIRGTTPHRLERPKEGFAMTRLTIQKISNDHDMLSKT
jgi:hypothetical protein